MQVPFLNYFIHLSYTPYFSLLNVRNIFKLFTKTALESAKLQMEGRTVSSKVNPQIVVNGDSPTTKLNKSPSFKTSPSDEGIDVSNENKIQVNVGNFFFCRKLNIFFVNAYNFVEFFKLVV